MLALKLRSNAAAGEPLPSAAEELDYPSIVNRALPDNIRLLGWADVQSDFNARYAGLLTVMVCKAERCSHALVAARLMGVFIWPLSLLLSWLVLPSIMHTALPDEHTAAVVVQLPAQLSLQSRRLGITGARGIASAMTSMW